MSPRGPASWSATIITTRRSRRQRSTSRGAVGPFEIMRTTAPGMPRMNSSTFGLCWRPASSAAGNPEVTALIVEIPPGGNTGWHSHPIPVYAYVLSGALTVEMDHSGPYLFKEGDALFEVLNTPHIGRNPGKEPVKLMVFYTGVEGTPSTEKISR